MEDLWGIPNDVLRDFYPFTTSVLVEALEDFIDEVEFSEHDTMPLTTCHECLMGLEHENVYDCTYRQVKGQTNE